MKILVTGGCGFIGSHVTDLFVNNGHEVVIVDDLSSGNLENKNEKARFYSADICGPVIDSIIREEKPDIIDHHAAQISVPQSVRDPLGDAEVNIKGTLRLLELSRVCGVRKFIFSSTGGAIYGEANSVPTSEEYVPQPASPYAISKFACEHYIRFYGVHHGLDYVILRYSNVYGPRQIPHGEAGVVAIFTEALFKKDLPTLYYFPGEPDGMVRDYCYVKDIAAANLLAVKTDKRGMYNIGTGRGTTTRELYFGIIRALRQKGVDLTPAFDHPNTGGAREGDIRVSTLNTGRAQADLGFSTAFPLDAGLDETVAWYLSKQKVQGKG
jgi:UDP-glucose 4-epimerase